jgi:2-polyprenyl-6-methoxyphenol hydroxylase-like FAD-dependent oxidoreductase
MNTQSHTQPSTPPDQDVDVLVVGAGPSGLTLSAALARAGVNALTVERHTGTSIFPKATGVRIRTMEILRSWGLDARLPERDADLRLVMNVSPTLAGPVLEEVFLGVPDDDGTFEVTPSRFSFVAQDRLEPVLLDHVREHGGDVRFRTELTSLTIGEDGATARLRSLASGAAYTVRARYVVGADGGTSPVRDAAGIGWSTLGTEGHHLSMLFHADLSPALGDRSAVLHMTVAPGAQGMFVATGERDRWIFDVEWSPESGDTVTDWTPERVRGAIRSASGLPDLEPRLEGVFPWEFGAAVAETQRIGPVFLVGDAAHRTTPRRATGMNTGIADAHNLGWKLAWVLRGWAHPSLLDSYDAERRPVGAANAWRSLEPAVDDDPERDIMADDLGVTYGDAGAIEACVEPATHSPRVGARAPHAWVRHEGAQVSILDLYDGRLTLVTGTRGDAWASAATELADGLPLQVVRLDTESDPSGTAILRYGLGAGDAVLVRPDGHVAAILPAGPVDAADVLGGALCATLRHGLQVVAEALAG